MTRPVETEVLRKLIDVAREAEAPEIAADATALAERVAEGRFYVACLGQFKRGKSTLLNALIGEPVLPVGIVPVTAVVTVLRYASERRARVYCAGNGWEEIDPAQLTAFVSEEQNPGNAKGVAAVEVFLPIPLLAAGMCLVDTPGVGSVFEANTEATHAFLPHVDAALMVLGADPPVSGEEAAIVETVAEHVHEMILVLNKADRLTRDERQQAAEFTQRVLAERLGKEAGPILQVSAAEQLTRMGPERDWPRLVQTLETMAEESGRKLVRAAACKGIERLVARLRHDLDERQRALTLPIDKAECRVATLRACVEQAEQSLNDLHYLLTGEQDRLSAHFAAGRETFLRQVAPRARSEMQAAIARLAVRGPKLRREALRAALKIATSSLDRWQAQQRPVAERMYREAVQRFVDLANHFLQEIAASAEILADLPPAVSPEVGFRTRSRLYYTDLVAYTTRSVFGWVLETVTPRRLALPAVRHRAARHLKQLLESNSTRVVNDLDELVRESRRRLESEIRKSLRDVYAGAERALNRAHARRAAGAQAVEAELARIGRLRRDVAELSS